MDMKIGDKVMILKVFWCGSGTTEDPLRLCDFEGKLTSIQGMPGHTNAHKYEFTTTRGRFYTNNEKRFRKI